VATGILERRPYESRPQRYEYLLTEKGRGLHPALNALVRWGDRHLSAEERAASNN
jgi:DNA-binding HxlR family transcriptional regulator